MAPPSLVVAGLGLCGVRQITTEVRDLIAEADRVLAVLDGGEILDWVAAANPRVSVEQISMVRWWVGPEADDWIESIVATALTARLTAIVLEGHPGVAVPLTHALITRAKSRGLEARMLPGVSTLDCLAADLGIDFVTDGCAVFDATDFLRSRPNIDPDRHLILLQIGVVGDPVQSAQSLHREGLVLLTRRLLEQYPAEHEVTVYEASVGGPYIKTVALSSLPEAAVTERSTLHAPYLRH